MRPSVGVEVTAAIRIGFRRWGPGVALWVFGLGISLVTLKDWIQLNDEGLMLQAAARIANGEVPYRDFWWFYPPGQPYLLALIWKLHGPSLVDWRIVRALANATVGVLVWRLALRRSGQIPALFAWAVAIFAVSSATGPHPYPIAMALALGSLLCLDARPWAAGILLGIVAAWRIEFAAYLGLGSALGLAWRGTKPRVLAVWFGSAIGAAAVFYVPVVAAAGAAKSWDLLVRYPVLEFSKYQTLPFPLVWDGGGNSQGLDLVAQFVSYHMPLALIIGLGSSLGALVLSRRDGRWLELAAGIFAVGMANYLVVRADAFHTGPLAIMDAVLAAWAVGAVIEVRRQRAWSVSPQFGWRPRIALLSASLACVSVGWALVDTVWKREREVREARHARIIRVDVADGVKELSETRCSLRGEPVQLCSLADLEKAVGWVRANTSGPIYVATKRSDWITAGAPLFYVLSGRGNVTAYDIAAPGVLTGAKVQKEIIEDLSRSGATVVRYEAGITAAPEPNQAGKSTGIRILDDWLDSNYVVVERFGVWVILQPSSGLKPPSLGAAEAK